MGSLGEIHFSLSRILNKVWEIITEIYVDDQENKHTIKYSTRQSVVSVMRERVQWVFRLYLDVRFQGKSRSYRAFQISLTNGLRQATVKNKEIRGVQGAI